MTETISENFNRVKSRGGWRSFFAQAFLMLLLSWPLFIIANASATGTLPTTARGFAGWCAEATGYYFIPLVPAWAAVRFNRLLGWSIWVLGIGFFTWGIVRAAA